LAKFYGQPPEVFLSMTVGEVRLHWSRTSQLLAQQQAEEEDAR
jgi:hypothetical protein